jgi:hypothetical protein
VLKFTMVYNIGTDLTAINRQFFAYTGGPPAESDVNNLANHVADAWSSFMAPLCTANYQMESVEGVDLASDVGAESTYVAAIDGTRGGDPLSAAACAVVSMSIGRRYRGGKPRTYWPLGVSSDLLNAQHWTTDFIGDVNTAASDFAAFVAAGVSGGTALGPQLNVSYYNGFLAVENPLTGRYS